MTENPLGAKIKLLRQAKGLSTHALATEVGVSRTYIYDLETQPGDWLNRPLEGGRCKQPSRDLIIRIGIVLAGNNLDLVDELLLIAGYAPLYPIALLDTQKQTR